LEGARDLGANEPKQEPPSPKDDEYIGANEPSPTSAVSTNRNKTKPQRPGQNIFSNDQTIASLSLLSGERMTLRLRSTARRKEIFEEMHPEMKATFAGGQFKGNQHKKVVDPESGSTTFIDATAKATGKSRTTISLDAERKLSRARIGGVN
jgi:hypothetical protein